MVLEVCLVILRLALKRNNTADTNVYLFYFTGVSLTRLIKPYTQHIAHRFPAVMLPLGFSDSATQEKQKKGERILQEELL